MSMEEPKPKPALAYRIVAGWVALVTFVVWCVAWLAASELFTATYLTHIRYQVGWEMLQESVALLWVSLVLVSAGIASTIVYRHIVSQLVTGRRNRRILRGLCVNCEYDLRGSQQSTHCPECGEPIRRSTWKE